MTDVARLLLSAEGNLSRARISERARTDFLLHTPPVIDQGTQIRLLDQR